MILTKSEWAQQWPALVLIGWVCGTAVVEIPLVVFGAGVARQQQHLPGERSRKVL